MASLSAPDSSGPNPNSPVPLDTIPVSPADGTYGKESKPEDGSAATNGAAAKKEYKETDQITVFHDPDNFNVKHPLMNHWTLWFTKPSTGKVVYLPTAVDFPCSETTTDILQENWNDLLKEVVTFDSVEEFWGVYVSLP